MTEEDKCPTFLIEDTPADEDAFGPHQRVADAIAELIESSEKGGKVIGLEGGWGAGKSTVVGFLVKRLSKNTNYTVISFDAWAHEGDPLRRTYLETLIQELRATKWVDDATWKKRREEIAHRRKETITRITPKPTNLGVALAISLLLVPLGSAFLAAGLRAGVTFGTDLSPNWYFIIGLSLGLSPFWVLLANFFRVAFTRGDKKSDSGKTQDVSENETDEVPSEWAFLFSRAINETRTETVESPNPTSIEFEDYFTKLMREALSASDERRCLLVLDNLDRVDPESALAIWSTLQTFLQDRSHRNEAWFRRLWVVVPFDPGGLRKLWDNRSSNSDTTALAGVNESAASDSFLDKSFQVRFHVPPPVLSDWKAYVYRLVEEAFPKHGQEDRHWIYRVFDHCRTRTGEPPTPRELKLYVNQIGAIHRQWEHAFPIEHVAYYVLHRRASKSIIERLRDSESPFPSEQDSAFLGESLRRNLAGLAFNVEASKGIELLLAEPIYQSLADGDSEKLKELEEGNPDGFWAVLEVVATSRLGDTDAQTIAKAASCLKHSGILDGNQRPESSSILNGLKSAGKKIEQWSPFDSTTANGLAALCYLGKSPELSASVMQAVAATLEQYSGDAKSSSEPQSVIEPLLTVMREVSLLGHESAIPQALTLPITAEAWPSACDFLAKADTEGKYWKFIRPKEAFAAVSSVIEPTVSARQFKEREITTIRVTSLSPIKSSWNAVVNAIRQRLDAGANVDPNEACLLFRGLFVLKSLNSAEATSLLKQLADNGHTLHHFHRANAEGHHNGKATSLFAFLRERPGAKKPGTAGNSDEGHKNLHAILSSNDADVASRLLALLRQFGEISLLLRIASVRSKYDSLICLGLRDVAEADEAEHVFTPPLILESWKELRSALNDSSDEGRFTTLVGRLAHSTSLCQSIQDADGGFSTSNFELYLSVIEGAKEELPEFAQWCKSGLERLLSDDWTAQLAGFFSCCRLALHLVKQGKSPELKTGFSDALATHAQSLLAGKDVPPNDLRAAWRKLLDCLCEEATRKELRTRLIDAAATKDGTQAASFFELYGDEISDAESLVAHNQIVLRLFSPILRERNVVGLNWLDEILDAHPDLLDKVSDKTAVKAFENRLRDCMTEPVEDEAQPIIKRIATTLGIESATDEAEINVSDGNDDARIDKAEKEGQ
ncbi:P-loop NTPase fold protein [Bremerella alba]|uniref:KAP NTPase domain-containing protein n=1 Tax=Bremerella alba TaxID=980252 RepID=A0A7V8V861_9BACT|nr:P-loop NTPase fold protein [Bremerella alba]MBA2116719.1 hypothetical protein [Bremerella alba]